MYFYFIKKNIPTMNSKLLLSLLLFKGTFEDRKNIFK